MTGGAATVSVVVPHFGDAAPTRELVRLLRADGGVHLLEILVVDDCSPEPLAPIEGARVLRREVNGGFGAAANLGARNAAGDLLLFLNSDVVPSPGFVDELVGAATGLQPACVGVTLVDDGSRVQSGFGERGAATVFLDRLAPATAVRNRLRRRPRSDPAPGPPERVDWVSGAAMLLPRESFGSVGGFDEAFHMYHEDVDLQHRLRHQGIPSYWVRDLELVHLGGSSSTSTQRSQWDAVGQFVFFRRRGRLPGLVGGYVIAAGLNFAYDVARRSLGKDVAPLHTVRSQARRLRMAMRESRRRIEAHPGVRPPGA